MISPRTEKELKTLENNNKSRKAAHPIAASRVGFESVESDTFTITGGNNSILTMRIKFTPTIPGKNGYTFVELRPKSDYPRIRYYCEPQSGDGTIILRVSVIAQYTSTTYSVKAVASGVTDGTFTRL